MDRRDGFELVLGLGLIAGAAWATERLVSRLLESAAETASINALIPPAAAALRNLRDALAQAGINTRVGSTRRTTAEQAAALASGHSSTTHSWHLLGRAVDLYPFDPLTGQLDLAGKNTGLYRKMHQIAAMGGWEGLAFNADGSRRLLINGAGQKYWDGGHLQFTQGMTFAQAQASDAGKYA